VIFRFGGTRWSGRSKKRVDRRAIWESIDADGGPRPVYIRARTGDLSRDPQYVGDRDDRIREFFSHVSGRSPT